MSQKRDFFTNYQRQFTFQNFPRMYYRPPPPPPQVTPQLSDEEFIRQFEANMPELKPKFKLNEIRIHEMKMKIAYLIQETYNIEYQERKMLASIDDASDENWKALMEDVITNRNVLKQHVGENMVLAMEMKTKMVLKRAGKRLRLRKQRDRLKKEKRDKLQEKDENSRRIDENLNKIKEDIQKAKQEEEAKFKADMVLKEVRRKKHDAKRSIVKLEALIKLRKARQNTAKGKGHILSEPEANTFQDNIDKLKSLWEHKLSTYEIEEAELRSSLGQSKDKEIDTVSQWRQVLFGGMEDPQVDFNGDFDRFIAVRAQWDRYFNDGPESNPIPIGWVLPKLESSA